MSLHVIGQIDPLAVLAAGLGHLAVGLVWFQRALFGRTWAVLTKQELKPAARWSWPSGSRPARARRVPVRTRGTRGRDVPARRTGRRTANASQKDSGRANDGPLRRLSSSWRAADAAAREAGRWTERFRAAWSGP